MSVNQLLTSTYLPYSAKIMEVSLPPKFMFSLVEMYDRSEDPVEYLETFKAHDTPTVLPRRSSIEYFL